MMARSRTGIAYRTARIPERDWQQQILDAARYLGFRCYHTYDSRRSAPGFPDLMCVRDGRLLAIECKTATGKVSPEQAEWLAELALVPGVVALIARPDDWDEIEQLLKEAGDER